MRTNKSDINRFGRKEYQNNQTIINSHDAFFVFAAKIDRFFRITKYFSENRKNNGANLSP